MTTANVTYVVVLTNGLYIRQNVSENTAYYRAQTRDIRKAKRWKTRANAERWLATRNGRVLARSGRVEEVAK